jgi:hypothetical protein
MGNDTTVNIIAAQACVRTVALCSILLAVASACSVVSRSGEPVELHDCEDSCGRHLHKIGFLIWDEKDFPSDFRTIARTFPDDSSARYSFICTASGNKPGLMRDVDKWTDYILVDWPRIRGTNNVEIGYPLIYCKDLRYHCGGIFVLKVGGEIVWDVGGSWLRQFAQEHPEYDITLPLP